MPRVMPITGTLVAMLVAAPAVFAQVTPSQDTAASPWRTPTFDNNSSSDTAFIRQAVRGNYTEVALGRLAESRAEDSSVKDFAERMVSDHNSMNEEWTALARDNDMKVIPEFGPAGQQVVERLEDLDGDEFDQAYMSEAIREHERDLAAFERMEQSAGSSEVRELASSGVSTIRQHLTLAQQVGSRVGVSSTAGRAGGVPVPAPVPSDDDRTRRTDEPTGDNRNDRNESGALRTEDRKFVQNVLQDHLMHIRLAEQAKREAKSEETRRLAERLERDFTEWHKRWENLATRYGLNLPSNLGPLHGKKVEVLKDAPKGDFDRFYASLVADHLASVVPYFQKEGQAVGAADVRRLVDDELPMIRENLSKAQRLAGTAKGKDEEKEKSSDSK